MKKILCLLFVVVLVFVLAGCNKNVESQQPEEQKAPETPAPVGEEAPSFKFTIATSATANSIIGQTMQYAADLINERSEGKIIVDAFPDGQLGSDTELVEGVQLGTLTMVIGTTAPQVSFVPDLAVFDIPNVYSDISTAQIVLNQFKEKMEPKFSEKGFNLCAMFPTVFRYMSSSKEVRSIDDFKGIKIRTMENPYHMAYWNALGATATPLAFSELYIGLQQGLVDAQENPLDIFMSSKFYEQQKYIIDTKHIAFIATILMNKEQWESMPAEYQNLMNECFEEASKFGTDNAKVVEEQNKQLILDAGVEIIELDQATYDAMVEKAAPVYDMIREAVGDQLVDEYLDAIEAAQ